MMSTMARKVISFSLVLMLMLTLVPVTFAAAPTIGAFAMSVDPFTVRQGNTDVITVPVRITGLPEEGTKIGGIGVNFKFDPDVLELNQSTSADSEEQIKHFAGDLTPNANDMILAVSQLDQGIVGYNFSNTGARAIDKAKITAGNIYCNLKFTLKSGADYGNTNIEIIATASLDAPDGSPIIDMSSLQTILNAGKSVNVVEEADTIKTIANTAAAKTIGAGRAWADVKGTLGKVDATSNRNIAAFGNTAAGQLDVTWAEPAGYDNTKAGTYTVTGQAVIPQGVELDSAEDGVVTMELTVALVKVKNVTAPAETSVKYGTAAGSVTLPSQVTVTVDQDYFAGATPKSGKLDVENWTSSDYTADKAGTYTFTATFKAKTGFDFSDAPAITASVKVKSESKDGGTGGSNNNNNNNGGGRRIIIDGGSNTSGSIKISFVIGEYAYTRNNTAIPMDVATGWDANGERTLVPIRFMSEALGYTVSWNDVDQIVTIQKDGVTISMTIGSNVYTVNGIEKTMDTAAELSNDRTFVPIRFVAEALGANVGWDGNTNRVTITN